MVIDRKCRPRRFASMMACALAVSASLASAAPTDPTHRIATLDDARLLTPFGGRAAFSPDGRKLAFVGKSYGDAFEMDIASRKVRNLTRGIPHQGIMRIQYLPNGDYLITAPRRFNGPNTRAHLEMWVLSRSLDGGLQPLDQQVFEGIAVSSRRNLIVWTVIEPELKPTESWQLAFVKPTKRYAAEVAYVNGVPRLANKHEIMPVLPPECGFIEPQDFRDDDTELVYTCMGPVARGDFSISVMGTRLDTGRSLTYFRQAGVYAEVEGVSPDGRWAAVECGKQDKPGLPPLDICRLDFNEHSELQLMVRGTTPGLTGDICNPVISPDGRWMAFQRSDSTSGEIGEGYGVYLLPLR